MTLPLAHHAAVAALPVFAPALTVVLVLAVRYLRERRHRDEEEPGNWPPERNSRPQRGRSGHLASLRGPVWSP